jgi:hypothetical protein
MKHIDISYREVPIRLVYIDPEDDEVREEEVEEKLGSYLRGGGIVINAPTVTKAGKRYRIWAGRHRYRSQRDAGLKRIKVGVVTGATEDDMRILMLQENLYRKKVTDAMEQTVELVARLKREGYRPGPPGRSKYVSIQAKLAAELNINRSTASVYYNIADRAIPELREAYKAKKVTSSRAAVISKLPPDEQAAALADELAKRGGGRSFDGYAYASLSKAARMLEANRGQPLSQHRLAALMQLVGKVQEALRGLRVTA